MPKGNMEKIKFGRNLLLLMLSSVLVLVVLNEAAPLGLQIILGGICFLSAFILWAWVLSDYFGHRSEFSSPNFIGFLLLFTNWGGAVIYYFAIIRRREQIKGITNQ